MMLEEMNDRLQLKELADQFANLSDIRASKELLELFTDDCVFEFQIGLDGVAQNITGKDVLLQAFSATLNAPKTMFHLSGQHTIKLNGNTATGIAYCQASLVNDENGKEVMTTNDIRYEDVYEKIDGKWFIKHRKSVFLISDKKELL